MKRIIITALLFGSFTSFGQDSFSLKQAQEYAILNNGNSKNAKLDLEIAEKKVWETTAIGLPQISGKVDFQNFIDIPTTVVPANTFNPMAPADEVMEMQFGTDYNVNATLQVSQLIFSGNYLVGLQASKAYTNTSKQLVEKSELETKAAVTEAYYTVLVLEENKRIMDSTLTSTEQIFEDTKILVEEKVVESTNAAQLELSVLQVQNGITQVEAQVRVAKNLLKMQMGMDLTKDITLTETLDGFIGIAEGITAPEVYDVSNNIDHKILESQLTLNELSLKNTKANYLPSLAAFFSHQQVAQRNEINFFDSDYSWYPTTLWGLNLTIPIFSSGQRASQVSQAQLEVMKSQNTMEQADKGIKLQMSQAVADFNSAKDVYNTQKKAIDVAKLIFDNTQIKYKEGIVSSLELTQVQTQYLTAQSNLTSAAFNLIKAKLSIDKLSNKL